MTPFGERAENCHKIGIVSTMMKRLLCHLLICFSVLLPASLQAASGPWQGNDVMDARLVAAVNAAGDTATIEAGLEFRLAPGWKVYWRSPGDAGLPPVLDFSRSGEITAHHLDFPAPERFPSSALTVSAMAKVLSCRSGLNGKTPAGR